MQQPSSKERDWRAGCECNRVGLCFRCQAAERIACLELQVYALTNANKSFTDRADGQPPNRHTPPDPPLVLEALQQVLLYADFDNKESHEDFQRAVKAARIVARQAERRAVHEPLSAEYVLLSDMVESAHTEYGPGLFCTRDAIRAPQPPRDDHQADYAAALREIAKGPHHQLANDEVAGWAMHIASTALSMPPRPAQPPTVDTDINLARTLQDWYDAEWVNERKLSGVHAGVLLAAIRRLSQPCAHQWEKIGISGDGHPFCSECRTNLIKEPPWGTAQPPRSLQRYFIQGRLTPISENGVTQISLTDMHQEAMHEVYLCCDIDRSPQQPAAEYNVGDRVSHDGHITEIVGVSVKYMLCGGAVVYAHDLQPASRQTKESAP